MVYCAECFLYYYANVFFPQSALEPYRDFGQVRVVALGKIHQNESHWGGKLQGVEKARKSRDFSGVA
jgi:hypothetical protein